MMGNSAVANWLRLAVLIALFLPFSASQASEEVFFAGVAYLGNSANVTSKFPYTVRLMPVNGSNERSPLEKAVAKKVSGVKPDHYTLNSKNLADIRQGESLSLALALDRETVSVEPVCGQYKVLVDIGAQALVFDFETMSIVGSYPITVQYIDVFDEKPTSDDIASLVHDLYLANLKVNILDEFVSLIKKVKVKRKYGNRIQVTKIGIGGKAQSDLPAKYKDNPNALKVFLAQSLGKALASEHGISVLPYTKGRAIGNKMSTRFANGSVFNLSIPEPDYHINLKLRGFKKVLFDKKESGQSVVYGSYINLKVFEPLSGKTYINQRFKRGATKVVPHCQIKANDWPAYQASLLGLFSELSTQVTKQDRKWAKSHAGKAGATDSLEQLEKVIKRCE